MSAERRRHQLLPEESSLPAWVDEFTVTSNHDNCSGDGGTVSDANANASCVTASKREHADLRDHEHEGIHEEISISRNKNKNSNITRTSHFENLPPDLSAHILSYNSMPEIMTYATLSKPCHFNGFLNEITWKLKFVQRYNAAHVVDPIHEIYPDTVPHVVTVNPNDDRTSNTGVNVNVNVSSFGAKGNVFWMRVYKAAYTNPHDLWLTHWNCTLPVDCISQGRCSIPDVAFKSRPNKDKGREPRDDDDKKVKQHKIKSTSGSGDESIVDDHNDDGSKNNNDEKQKDIEGEDDIDRILNDRYGKKCPTCRYHPLMDGGAPFRDAMNAELEFEQREEARHSVVDHQNTSASTAGDNGGDDVKANSNANKNTLVSDPTIINEFMTAVLSQSIEEEDKLGNCLGYATPSEVIRRSTQFSLSKWCRRMRAVHNLDLREQPWEFHAQKALEDSVKIMEDDNHNGGEEEQQQQQKTSSPSDSAQFYSHSPFMKRRREDASRAFEKASTFKRNINTEQYRSSGLNFMTDALFFPIEPLYEKLETISSIIRGGISIEEEGTGTKSSNLKSPKMSELEHSILDLYGSANHEEDSGSGSGNGSGSRNAKTSPSDPLNDLKHRKVFEDGTLAGLGPKFETAQHSWHIIRLTNPDYEHPIAFRIYIQRPECYCAYPSEGFLKPGETMYVTLGVRALGSVMAKAFDCTDTLREENPLFLSDVLEEESCLPLNGFAIRYITSPVVPCVPIPFYRSSDANWSNSNIDPSQQRDGDFAEPRDEGLVNRMWCNLQSESEIRTIHVSTHVHGMYSFDQFQNLTMVPFDVRQKRYNSIWMRNRAAVMYAPLTLMCPLVQRRDPRVFSDIHDMNLEMDPFSEGFCYRTEKNCSCCGRNWGARSEYLGRAFALRKAVCSENHRMRSRQIRRSMQCLEAIPDLYETFMDEIEESESENSIDKGTVLNKLQQLLFCIRAVIIYARADKLMTPRQIEILTSYELYENTLSEKLASCLKLYKGNDAFALGSKRGNTLFWRFSGIYGAPRLSAEENDKRLGANDDELQANLKNEPRYLKQLKAMSHHKGYYNIGRQEDPNHPQKDNCCDIDMVGNSLTLGGKSAMSLIQSPKSIEGHGTYDLSIYPGVILKSRIVQAGSFLRVHKKNDFRLKGFASRVIARMKTKYPQKRGALHRLNGSTRDKSWAPLHINDLDPSGYHLIMFQRSRDIKEKYNISALKNMLRNVPDPGCGRFALSILSGTSQENTKVKAMFPFLNVPAVDVRRHMTRRNSLGVDNHNDNPVPPVGGLRVLNSVWYVCDLFGLKIVDESAPGIVVLDRRMMIAMQWFSYTLMVFPLLWSLVARWAGWIPTHPPDYVLKGLQNNTHKEMRYVSPFECGVLAITLSFLYIFLGRCAERHTLRTFDRVMIDDYSKNRKSMLPFPNSKFKNLLSSYQDFVDRCIPIYLQRIFWRSPGWNYRSIQDIQRYIFKRRSADGREHRTMLHAESGQQRGDRILKQSPIMRSSSKGGICILVGLSSFISCSPNYSLNLCTVFFCSIATGLSISVNHMETTRTPRGKSVISSFDNMNLHTAVVVFFLIGQVVGSSGGIQFLAEFVVTAVGLLLGGAATVSTAGIESWLSFFGLSSTAFWGYFLSRVGLSSSIRYKKCSLASGLLMCSLVVMTILWIGTIKSAEDELPTKLMMLRYDYFFSGGSPIAVLAGRHLLT